MRFFLNDYEINSAANGVYINEDIDGLDLPDIRSSRGQRAGQSGSYFGAQLFDSRHITIRGTIFSETVSEALQKRREIQAVLVLFPEVMTVRIIDDDGRAYVLSAQVMDFKMPIQRFRGKSVFKLELEAPDPVIYDDTAGSALTATITQAAPGGMYFSSITPWFGHSTYFSSGAANTTVDNDSLVTVAPVITITGKTTDPILTNVTTGEVWSLTGYAVPGGSVTVIDMQAHTVTLNGGNVFAYVPLDADWWGLVPGMNEIAFSSGAGSDVHTAVMTWRPGLRGI